MEIRMTEYDTRKQKIQTLRTLGINPFVQKRDKTHSISNLLSSGTEGNEVEGSSPSKAPLRTIEDILSGPQTTFSTAGRLMLKRVAGKLAFGQIMDETGTIQIMREHQNSKLLCHSCAGRNLSQDFGTSPEGHKQESEGQAYNEARQELLGESTKSFDYWFVDKMLDIGDFVGIRGELFMTHKGELTLFVSEYQLLSKAVRPLGDKFHGIGEDNAETAYRQRYLDMIFNADTLQRMKLRSRFLKVIRDFYDEHGFIEIETPVLGNSASGAAAAPFSTHHNDFDQDMYLRISPETNLKKATVGMLEKIFEVAKDFRNEGSDPSHIQEFTMIEHYAAYRNHEDNMLFTEQMFDYIFAHIPELKKTITVIDKNGIEKEVSFQTPRARIDYISQIKQDSGIDVSHYTADDEAQLRTDIKAKGHTREGLETQGTATMIDYLYKKVTRPQIVGPAFIVNYPKTMQPLARQSDANPNIVEQRQLLINGREVIKAYCELVDPIQQQANFDEQAGAVAKGDDEATKSDDDFVKAMEYGMPPQSGRGMGIDRIFSLLMEQSNIRDVVLFPLVKAENKE